MFNVDKELASNFSVPTYDMQYLYLAYNEAGVAELYVEFEKQIWTKTIKDKLAELGARSVNGMTFQHNDGNHSAASALNRVRKVAKSQGFTEVVRGACNAKLLAKADELLAAEKQDKVSEFDEKTQAAIKLSLEMTEEIKSNMATKEDLSHLEEISDEIKSSVMEMKENIQVDYKDYIAKQAMTIVRQDDMIASLQESNSKLNECLVINDRKTMLQEKQIESQRYIIAKLNEDIRKREQQTAQLNATIEQKNQVILRLTDQGTARGEDILQQIQALLAEAQEGRKRKHDE